MPTTLAELEQRVYRALRNLELAIDHHLNEAAIERLLDAHAQAIAAYRAAEAQERQAQQRMTLQPVRPLSEPIHADVTQSPLFGESSR